MAKSSYTLVYGAFAGVPLFLMWIYVTWIIVLLGAVLTHSLSAYQTTEQAKTPRLVKALNVLYLLWLAQQEGRGVSELEIIDARTTPVRGVDSDSWRSIRDTLIDAQWLKRPRQRQLPPQPGPPSGFFGFLADLIRSESDFGPTADALPWQEAAINLLSADRTQRATRLDVSLATLFSGDDGNR